MKKVIVLAAVLLLATSVYADKRDTGPVPVDGGNLDCTGASAITCGETRTGAIGFGGNVALYGCTGLDYDLAEEAVYELCVGGDGTVDINMTYAHGGSNDLDLFLLGSCDEANCIDASLGTSGVEDISAFLTAGTYYVVVDGWIGLADGSPHTVSVACQAPCATAVEPTTWGAIKAQHK